MSEKTIIIHGWSDHSDSFVGLKAFIARELNQEPIEIYFADYQSEDDQLTLEKVGDDLQAQLIQKKLVDPQGAAPADGKLNIVVHSTGGLVVRQWLRKNYFNEAEGRLKDNCPVLRVVMLAPANFGSPLAEMGKSLLGRLGRGQMNLSEPLEVGQLILDDLEIASKYQWDLAHQDLLIPKPYFAYGQIKTTILVGGDLYGGLRRLISQPGTDGTVIIAGTSLDSAKVILDVTDPEKPLSWHSTAPLGEFAFGVLKGYNHGSITQFDGDGGVVGKYLLKALRVQTPQDIAALDDELAGVTRQLYEPGLGGMALNLLKGASYHRYQQFLVHAVDDDGESIPHFWFEFFVLQRSRMAQAVIEDDPLSHDGLGARTGLTDDELQFTARLNQVMTRFVHTFSKDSSFRSFLVDLADYGAVLKDVEAKFQKDYVISARIYVQPLDGNRVQFDDSKLKNVVLYDPQKPGQPSLIFPNTTTLVEIRVKKAILNANPQVLEVTVDTRPYSEQRKS